MNLLKTKLKYVINNRRNDFEQCTLRSVIGFFIFLYIGFDFFISPISFIENIDLADDIFFVITGHFLVSTVLFLALFIKKYSRKTWRAIGMVSDLGFLSLGIVVAPDVIIPLFSVYLWVIVGYGFRYGSSYLLVASSIAVVLFGIGWYFAEANHSLNPTEHDVAIGIMIALFVIPGYVYVLLTRTESATAKLAIEKEKARAASEEKSNFLANVSHELRTPLNGVVAVGELLSTTELDEKQAEYVEVISTSSKILRAMINDILNFSKIESGVIELEHTLINLTDLVNQVVTILRPITKDKGIQFESRMAEGLPEELYGDPTKLSEILMNLGNNAIKFTDVGYVILNVYPKNFSENKVTVRFEVIDTGIGIPQESIGKIFDRFKQQDETITRRYGGTGLGTTISKSLVELMGGQIGVMSEHGVGSRFWFEVPFDTPESVERSITVDNNVVIVTDNLSRVQRLKGIIEQWGYSVDIDHDMRMLEKLTYSGIYNVPTAVIVDQGMGDKAYEIIKGVDRSKAKLIAVLLLGSTKQVKKPHLRVYDAILPAPVETRQLYHALHIQSHEYDPVVTSISAAYNNKPSRLSKQKRSQLSILVCDDEKTNRYVMNEMLKKMGHEVTLAEDGFQALELLKDNNYQIVILDLQMPDLSGIEVAEMYQYTNPDSPARLIMASANVKHEVVERAKDLFDEYLEKPIDYGSLDAVITRVSETFFTAEQSEKVDLTRCLQNTLFDKEDFHDHIGTLDSDFISDLFDMFQENSNELMQKIKTSLMQKDLEAFKQHMHALKGIAGNVKATQLEAITRYCKSIDTSMFAVDANREYLLNELLNSLKLTHNALYTYIKEEHSKNA